MVRGLCGQRVVCMSRWGMAKTVAIYCRAGITILLSLSMTAVLY